jgi:predicted transcriptional regulator
MGCYVTRLDKDPERWRAFVELTNAGVSLNELRRTLGVDHRTVKRYLPGYSAFPVGGGGDAALVRETYRQLKEFERKGRVESNRDAGFNLRRDAG